MVTDTARGISIPAEIDRWEGLGIPTLPGPHRAKGSRVAGWPALPREECWAISRGHAAKGAVNLLVRSGATARPDRYLTAIDLDGKCPCGHDHTDHREGGGCRGADACACETYHGRHPEAALAELRVRLPADVAVAQTARGYHVYFLTTEPTAAGALPAFSAEVYGNRQGLHVPGSVHPSGWRYRWITEPGASLPLVDLAAAGLSPEPKAARSCGPARPTAGAGGPPAAPAQQREFRDLMGAVGVRPGGGVQEHHPCAWHADGRTDSLHIDWRRCLFHCFSCGTSGGLPALRHLVEGPPPTCGPVEGEGSGSGLQLGGGWAVRRAESQRYADALDAIGEGARAVKVRACATTFQWDPERADAWEAFACPNGDSTPVRAVRPHSCDDHLCPTCMPQRLGNDFSAKNAQADLPDRLAIVRLRATEATSLEDATYLTRVRGRFREYRRAHALDGGLYGLTLVRGANVWHAEILIGLDADTANALPDGRAFVVELVTPGATSADLLAAWQTAYLAEATSWETPAELAALRALTRGRRRFQGVGTAFNMDAVPGDVPESRADPAPETTPLHRVSGGAGRATRTAPCCPRCGARLEGLGRFDPERMEAWAASDGLLEWRWRQAERGVA